MAIEGITSAAEAAQAWREGRREDAREWCLADPVNGPTYDRPRVACRTAAVALELDEIQTKSGITHTEVWALNFLRYMRNGGDRAMEASDE